MKMKYFILLLLISTEYHALSASNPHLSNEWMVKAAKYGVQMIDQGTLYRFENYWDQIIMIRLPKIQEYRDVLSSLKLYCEASNPSNYEQFVANSTAEEDVQKEAKIFYDAIKKRCTDFQLSIEEATDDLIAATYHETLPHPSYPESQYVPINMRQPISYETEQKIFEKNSINKPPKYEHNLVENFPSFVVENQILKNLTRRLSDDFVRATNNMLHSNIANVTNDIKTNDTRAAKSQRSSDILGNGLPNIGVSSSTIQRTTTISSSTSRPLDISTHVSTNSSTKDATKVTTSSPILRTTKYYPVEQPRNRTRNKRELVTIMAVSAIAGLIFAGAAGIAGLGMSVWN